MRSVNCLIERKSEHQFRHLRYIGIWQEICVNLIWSIVLFNLPPRAPTLYSMNKLPYSPPTKKKQKPKYVPQLFLRSLLGMCRSAIGQFFFFRVSSASSRSVCELVPVSLSFLKWQINIKLTCIELITAKRYWNTGDFSWMDINPRSHVTPNKGIRITAVLNAALRTEHNKLPLSNWSFRF